MPLGTIDELRRLLTERDHAAPREGLDVVQLLKEYVIERKDAAFPAHRFVYVKRSRPDLASLLYTFAKAHGLLDGLPVRRPFIRKEELLSCCADIGFDYTPHVSLARSYLQEPEAKEAAAKRKITIIDSCGKSAMDLVREGDAKRLRGLNALVRACDRATRENAVE